MIKVQCPTCGAPYDLDEGRLPASGMKMRCPKCEAKFTVKPSGETSLEQAAAPPAAPPGGLPAGLGGAPGAAPKPPGMRKATMIGVSPIAAGAGVPKPPAPAPAAPPPIAAKPPAPAAAPTPPAAPPAGNPFAANLKKKGTMMGGIGGLPPMPGLPPLPGAVAPPPPAPAATPDESAMDFSDIDLSNDHPDTEPPPADLAPPPVAPPSLKNKGTMMGGIGGLPPMPGKPPAMPAAKNAPLSGLLDVDLPALKGGAQPAGFGEIPSTPDELRGLTEEPALAIVDLPAPKKTAVQGGAGLREGDLPSPKAAANAGGMNFGEIDLPAPKAARAPSSSRNEIDLPAPKNTLGIGDLPAPALKGIVDLPTPKGGFGSDIDLPVSKAGRDLPRVKDGASAFGEIDLPVSAAGKDLPAKKGGMAFGELDLGLPGAPSMDLGLDGPDGLNLELPDIPEPTGPKHSGAPGGVGFGELDLGEAEPSSDMELELPQETAGSSMVSVGDGPVDGDNLQVNESVIEQSAAAQAKGTKAPSKAAPAQKRASKFNAKAVLITVGVALVATMFAFGVLLKFTKYGLMGQYFLERFGPGAGNLALVDDSIKKTEKAFALDTLADDRKALKELSRVRMDAGINRKMLVESAAYEVLHFVRFDDRTFQGDKRLNTIMARVDERAKDTPHVGIAIAARALMQGDFKGAIERASQEEGLSAALILAEAQLEKGDRAAARKAFAKAKTKGGGARATWGVARTYIGQPDTAALAKAIEETLKLSPNHAEARVEKARLFYAEDKIDDAVTLLKQVIASNASKSTKSDAWTVLGLIDEHARNRTKARDAYEKALLLDAYNAEALVFSSKVLLLENRPDEAQARFEMVIKGGDTASPHNPTGRPISVEAKLGSAQALLKLGRVQEARGLMEDLAGQRQDDPVVMLWLGKTEEAANDVANAEQHYRDAIGLDPKSFIGYMALAELFFSASRPNDAAVVLEQARKEVADGVDVRRMLGQSELQRDHVPEAIVEFKHALELDPTDVESLFQLGIAERRNNQFAEAAATLDMVMKLDPAWPGVAVERGRIFEAQGQSRQAVTMYTNALKEAPNDIDLKLRLGAAQVLAGDLNDAEKTLLEVDVALPRSAETKHYLGRVAYGRGDLEGASAQFKHSIDLDPSRGTYYTYYAWAELERGNLATAETTLKRAIELDPSQGEAFWVRGRLHLRTGAVKDALKDLTKAVALNPNLTEAYANMADCYSQLNKPSDAIKSYQTALARDPNRGDWWFELGKLLLNAEKRVDAEQALARATDVGEKMNPHPGWLADAYRWHGDAARVGDELAKTKASWLRFLELAPKAHVDREYVKKQLKQMGVKVPEEDEEN